MIAEEDEYELLPRQEVENLKKDIERLKKNPLGDLKEGETLLESINNLNTNIQRLIDIFAKAGADLEGEYSEASPVEDIKSIRGQNEQIAEGILTVADMLKEMKEGMSVSDQPMPSPRLGPRIPMIRPSFESAGQPSPQSYMEAPFPEPGNLPDDFPGAIPPPPQPFIGAGGEQIGRTPFEAPMPEKRRGLFRK